MATCPNFSNPAVCVDSHGFTDTNSDPFSVTTNHTAPYRVSQANATVPKAVTITNHSVSGIVTATPGSYPVTFALVANVTDTGKSQAIREQVPVAVK